MFAKDSGSGRGRGQSSWGNDWRGYDNDSGYGRNQAQSHDNNDDFQHQGFGRNLDREDSGSSKIVCQNYLQNKCMRGNNCLFLHPPNSSGSSNSSLKRQQNPWLNFCTDFQRGQCPFSDDCRLLHVSRRDEMEYNSSGDIPANVVEQAMSKAMVMDWAYIGNHPHCKEYLQGSCNMRGCNYRHLNTDQYVVEVLAALREKFMIPHDEMFQDVKGSGFSGDQQGGGQFGMRQPDSDRFGAVQGEDDFSMRQRGNDQFGMRQQAGDQFSRQKQDDNDNYGMQQRSGDQFGMRQGFQDRFGSNDFQPDAKRMRGMDFDMDNNSRNRNEVSGSMHGGGNEDFLDDLRRQNMNAIKTNDDVKRTAQSLEQENQELRKALRLALDLNNHARDLQEFRENLRDIQSTLRKRGYRVERYSNSGMDMPVDRPRSSQEGRMGGDRYSLNMGSRDFDRMDMPRSGYNFQY